jgi:hypothetical protein
MEPDPLKVIAESSRSIAESTAALAKMQRLAFRLQAFVCVLVSASLLFLGFVVWQHLRSRHALALVEQALTAEIQALRDQLRQR